MWPALDSSQSPAVGAHFGACSSPGSVVIPFCRGGSEAQPGEPSCLRLGEQSQACSGCPRE